MERLVGQLKIIHELGMSPTVEEGGIKNSIHSKLDEFRRTKSI
jgi:hypothetical protein